MWHTFDCLHYTFHYDFKAFEKELFGFIPVFFSYKSEESFKNAFWSELLWGKERKQKSLKNENESLKNEKSLKGWRKHLQHLWNFELSF